MKKMQRELKMLLDGPPLEHVTVTLPESVDKTSYPFCVPLIQNLTHITFPTDVTFFIGENGTGKSTILEAIASKMGFGAEGGSKNITFTTTSQTFYRGGALLAEHLTLTWRYKMRYGYFFRAESFFNIATYIDMVDASQFYGGKSLHHQSHGESFMSFFQNRLGSGGFFIFDEPEAALSPQRQLALMAIIHQLCKTTLTQCIIATHSPILLAYPQATIYSCDGDTLAPVAYTQTSHYQLTKRFLDNPALYLQYLFEDHSFGEL